MIDGTAQSRPDTKKVTFAGTTQPPIIAVHAIIIADESTRHAAVFIVRHDCKEI
jgi:hypothetical protein